MGFKQVARWRRKVEEECGNIPMVLVMTKMDLLYRATVDSAEVEKMARSLGIQLIKTSVKENLNVPRVFQHLASQHLASVSQWSSDPPLIQIGGGGGWQGFSQSDFLTRYERNCRRKKKRMKAKAAAVNLCSNSYSSYCDTRAFFLSPVRKKSANQKLDFGTVCKIL